MPLCDFIALEIRLGYTYLYVSSLRKFFSFSSISYLRDFITGISKNCLHLKKYGYYIGTFFLFMNLRCWTRKFWSDIGYSLGSSRWLARRVIAMAEIQGAGTIVELGAGYGALTRYLIQYKSPETKLIIVENDAKCIIQLRREYGQYCDIHEISAAHIGQILPVGSVDIVVSTLPLGSISPEWVDHILRAAEASLRIWGRFVQYQYALQNISDVRRYFDVTRIVYELRNFWPAFIYVSHKK